MKQSRKRRISEKWYCFCMVFTTVLLGNTCITNLCQSWINCTIRDADVFVEETWFFSLQVKNEIVQFHICFSSCPKLHLNRVYRGLILTNSFRNLMSSAHFRNERIKWNITTKRIYLNVIKGKFRKILCTLTSEYKIQVYHLHIILFGKLDF